MPNNKENLQEEMGDILARSRLLVTMVGVGVVIPEEERLPAIEKVFQESKATFESEAASPLEMTLFISGILSGINLGIINPESSFEKISTAAEIAFLVGYELRNSPAVYASIPGLLRALDQYFQVINPALLKEPRGRKKAEEYWTGPGLFGVFYKKAILERGKGYPDTFRDFIQGLNL